MVKVLQKVSSEVGQDNQHPRQHLNALSSNAALLQLMS